MGEVCVHVAARDREVAERLSSLLAKACASRGWVEVEADSSLRRYLERLKEMGVIDAELRVDCSDAIVRGSIAILLAGPVGLIPAFIETLRCGPSRIRVVNESVCECREVKLD